MGGWVGGWLRGCVGVTKIMGNDKKDDRLLLLKSNFLAQMRQIPALVHILTH